MQYWIGLAALAQSLGGMHKGPSAVWNVVRLHTQHVRHLQMVMPSSSSSSLFESTESTEPDEMTKLMGTIKDKCNLDVQDLMVKVGGMLMMTGAFSPPEGAAEGAESENNMVSSTNSLAKTETSPEDQVTFLNLFHEAVKPAGEKQCTKDQNKQYLKASEKFTSCIGIDVKGNVDFENDKDKMEDIAQKCDQSTIMVNPDNCTEAVLSDEIIGGVLRDMYQHSSKYCSCLQNFKEDIPSCTLLAGSFMDDSGAEVPDDFNAVYREMKLSLGFFKSELCVIGLGCDTLKGVCVDQLNALENCMGENPGCESEPASPTCEASAFYSMPPALSQGQLPDICLKVYEDNKMTSSAVSDFARHVQTCHPEVMTTAAAKQQLKPSTDTSSGKSSGWIDAMVIIGVIAVAVLGFAMAVVHQLHKQEKVEFEPLNTDELAESELEELS